MATKRCILLDKSYLQGARPDQVIDLCNSYRVLMTETLVFEIMTSTPEKTRACFAKLPGGSKPVEIVPDTGYLMRKEVERGESCGPVLAHRLLEEWSFNPGLADGSFQSSDELSRCIADWLDEEQEFVDGFLAKVAIADRTFPPLAAASPGERLEVALDLCHRISSDSDGVREFYAATRPAGFPPLERLEETWAIFRWYQVNMAAVAEFFARHGAEPDAAREKVMNERLDLDHTAVALLVGGLASCDKTMLRRFCTLCPAGEVQHL